MDKDSEGEFDDDLPAEAFSLEDPSESYLEFPIHAGKKAELRALLARPRALAIQHSLPDPPLLDSWRPLGSSEHDMEMEGDTTSHGVQLPKSFSTIYKEVSQTIDQEGQEGEFIPPGTYYYLALLSFFAGEFEPTVAYLQLTLEADSPRARALNLLGLAYHMQGFEVEAEARLREAANTKGISPADRGIILTNLGLVFTYRRAPDDALRHYAKALDIHRQQGDRFSQAEILSRMGRLCRAKRSLDEASRYHQEALENWKKLGDKFKVSLELRLLAAVFREEGNYKEALDLSQRALQMNRELRDHREEAINLGNIGLIYSVERDYSEALKFFRAALALHQRVGNLKGEANNLGNVGNILFLMGKSDDALQAYQSALEINQNIGYRWGEAIDLGNIGRIQIQENNMEAAGASLRDAQRIFRDLNATTQAETLQNTLDQISAHIPSDP
jgi:tetratricopeptide (TPR) repeat protein